MKIKGGLQWADTAGATWHFVAVATARFIAFAAADEDHGVVIARGATINQALGAAGFCATDDADGVQLVYPFCQGQEQRHGAKGFATEVLIQTRADDAASLAGEGRADICHCPVEELDFVNGDDFRLAGEVLQDFDGIADGDGIFAGNAAVRGDTLETVAVVDERLEDLDFAAGDLGAADAAEKFFGFAAEH